MISQSRNISKKKIKPKTSHTTRNVILSVIGILFLLYIIGITISLIVRSQYDDKDQEKISLGILFIISIAIFLIIAGFVASIGMYFGFFLLANKAISKINFH